MDMGVCCLNLTCYNRVICFEHDWAHLQSTITNYTQSVIPGDLGELIGGVVIVRWWHLTSCDFKQASLLQGLARYPRSQTDEFCDWQPYMVFLCSFRKLLIFRTIYLQIWWWYIYVIIYIYIYLFIYHVLYRFVISHSTQIHVHLRWQ
jgi:hypothetical protein